LDQVVDVIVDQHLRQETDHRVYCHLRELHDYVANLSLEKLSQSEDYQQSVDNNVFCIIIS